MLYTCIIYDRHGLCLFYKEWQHEGMKRKKRTAVEADGDSKLVYGLLFSLKAFNNGIAPKPSDTWYSYKTSTYKFHFYDSPTGYKFILLTDPNVPTVTDHLKHIYKAIFTEYVKKNPLYKLGTKITCHLFEEQLDKYVQQYPFYSS